MTELSTGIMLGGPLRSDKMTSLDLDRQSTFWEVIESSFNEGLVRSPGPSESRANLRSLLYDPNFNPFNLIPNPFSPLGDPANIARNYLGEKPQEPKPDQTRVNPFYQDKPWITPDEANERYKLTDPQTGNPIKLFDKNIHPDLAFNLFETKRAEIERQRVLMNARGGVGETIGSLGAGLVASVLDPYNVASMFVPIFGQVRYARWLEAATESAGLLGRVGVRGAVGLGEGLAGSALVEPRVYLVAQSEKADYDMADSLLNVGLGGVLGGGMHMGLGALGDAARAWSRRIDIAPAEVREDLLRGTAGAIINDQPVRADLILKEHIAKGNVKPDPTTRGNLIDPIRMQDGEVMRFKSWTEAQAHIDSLKRAETPTPVEAPRLNPEQVDPKVIEAIEKYAKTNVLKREYDGLFRRENEDPGGYFDLIAPDGTNLGRHGGDARGASKQVQDAQRKWLADQGKPRVEPTQVQTEPKPEYSVVRDRDGYAIVRGTADQLDQHVQARADADVDDAIARLQTPEARAELDQEIRWLVDRQLNETTFSNPRDADQHQAMKNLLKQERHFDQTGDRPGGKTEVQAEIGYLNRQIQEDMAEIERRIELGEIDRNSPEYLELLEAERDIQAVERANDAMRYLASCTVGVV